MGRIKKMKAWISFKTLAEKSVLRMELGCRGSVWLMCTSHIPPLTWMSAGCSLLLLFSFLIDFSLPSHSLSSILCCPTYTPILSYPEWFSCIFLLWSLQLFLSRLNFHSQETDQDIDAPQLTFGYFPNKPNVNWQYHKLKMCLIHLTYYHHLV